MDAIILNTISGNSLSFNAYNNCNSYNFDYSDEDEAFQYNFAYDYNEDGYPRQVIISQGGASETIEINYN